MTGIVLMSLAILTGMFHYIRKRRGSVPNNPTPPPTPKKPKIESPIDVWCAVSTWMQDRLDIAEIRNDDGGKTWEAKWVFEEVTVIASTSDIAPTIMAVEVMRDGVIVLQYGITSINTCEWLLRDAPHGLYVSADTVICNITVADFERLTDRSKLANSLKQFP